MAVKNILHLILNLLATFNSIWFTERAIPDFSSTLSRSSFPQNFTFGTGSSSYQCEGAYNEDGRGIGIWDTFTHKHPERIADSSNGDAAVDHYHRYKEDVALVKEVGMDAYRFSISWPRILPKGKLSRGLNTKGIQFYNNLIDELLSKGLQPYVTIFHWDVPQPLEDEYGGFLSSRIIKDFQDYAELCFKEFGDRVKVWFTLNEPYSFSNAGYNLGVAAPGRCSKYVGNCTQGNSATEPYITGHNQLLAHAAAVNVYREKYQAHQKGKIGMTNLINWMVPLSETKIDRDAAQRVLDFSFGWFMNPITYGKYPKIMRTILGDRLPRFSREQSDMLKGSCDFVGINYYTANYAANNPFINDAQPSYNTDFRATLTTERNGVAIGPKAGSSWLCVYPRGIFDILLYTKQKYENPTIYITENGIDEVNNNSLSLDEALSDEMRVDFHRRHLKYLLRAINEGVDLIGYFVWSLLDNFEWIEGYTVRFGMNYIDYKTMTRYPKHSSIWFKKFLLHA